MMTHEITLLLGVLNGKFRVYVDPYAANVAVGQYYVIGYKGTSPLRFWFILLPICSTTNGESSWSRIVANQKIGFKTRYGMVQKFRNYWLTGALDNSGAVAAFSTKRILQTS